MFTGIIENIGTVKKVTSRGNYLELTIAPDPMFENMKTGESIAVSGPCLTVVGFDSRSFTVEASQETVRLTTMKDLRAGDYVNLERALRADLRLGGHIVAGHIDTILRIVKVSEIGRSLRMEVELPEAYSKFIVDKGSVAMDGVSLTVMEVTDNGFAVNLIPETQKTTLLADKKAGDSVNIEFDVMGKYILRYLDTSRSTAKLDYKKMKEWGY